MQSVGFRVSIWCPRSNASLLTGAIHQHQPYRLLDPVASMEAAILATAPDFIVPCDEPATVDLQQVAQRAMAAPRLAQVLRVIEFSLGPAANLKWLTDRFHVLQTAEEGGAAVPAYAAVPTQADLRAWLDANGFPAYLKADGTFGAMGVRRVDTYEKAESAFLALHEPPAAMRAFRRFALHDDPTVLRLFFSRYQPAISIQRAVAGVDVNSAIFCWRGRVLATLSMQVIEVRYERGPSTVLHRIQNPMMDRAADILASRLNLSGFYGLDFILEDKTGIPWLLEMNSRATQIPHLALGVGHDLPAAAFAAITGRPVCPRPPVTSRETIALFPQEWDRDPASPLLRSSYHDVPWESPALIRAFTKRRSRIRRLLTRLFAE